MGDIEYLTPENYATWSADMKVLLMDRGCWGFIDGTEKVPDDSVKYKEKQNYNLRRDRAFSSIYLNVSPELRPLLSETTIAKEAWEILEENYRPKTRAAVISLLDSFFACRYEEGEGIGLFAARLRTIIKQLRDQGHPLENLYQAFQLIRFLPEEFSNIVLSIYRYTDDDFKFDAILKELLLEESRLKQCNLDKTNAAFESKIEKPKGKSIKRYKTDSKKQFTPLKREVICFKCKQSGHIAPNCGKKPSKEIKRRGGNIPNTSFATEKLEANHSTVRDQEWLFDTAATTHFCKDRSLFSTYKTVSGTDMSVAIGEVKCPVLGIGTVDMFFYDKGKKQYLTLKNVMYTPKLRRNLMSGPALDNMGTSFSCKSGRLTLFSSNGRKIFTAIKTNGFFICRPKYPTIKDKKAFTAETQKCEGNLKEWHTKFCHINTKYILNTSKNGAVLGIPNFKEKAMPTCDDCKIAKSRRVSFKSLGKTRSSKPLELIWSDVCGPLPVKSNEGARYFVSFIDDYSKKVVVYPMKQKNEVFEYFKRFQRRAERFLNSKIINLRSDNGLEYVNNTFSKYLEDQGIRHERSNAYTPEQNGTSENFNCVALNAIKALLHDSKLNESFWAEALLTFVYTWNRVCHGKQVKTPFELYGGRKPSVKHLKPFGSAVYVGKPKQLRNKFSMRAQKGIMVGYALCTKGYRVWLPRERKTIETINVTFLKEERRGIILDPNRNSYDSSNESDSDSDEETNGEDEPEQDPKEEKRPKDMKSIPDQDSAPDQKNGKNGSAPSISKQVLFTPGSSKPQWERLAVKRKEEPRRDIYYRVIGTKTRLKSWSEAKTYCDKNNIPFKRTDFDFRTSNTYSGPVKIPSDDESDNEPPEANFVDIKIPSNYNEACDSPQKKNWFKAMEDEIQTMKDRKVWTLTPKPAKATIINNRWVYTVKRNENHQIVRYKARLVAQGFRQKKGINYDEVFSPVVNFSVIRLFFAVLVCLYGWLHCQLDIKAAYLYAKLNNDIYMNQPQGFTDKNYLNHVCKLSKAIYGLKQSGREWFFEINAVLTELRFKRLTWCNCVYVYRENLILLLYVDDIILFGKTSQDINLAIEKLKSKFDLKILGKTTKLLGVTFEGENKTLCIHQSDYISEVYEKFSKFKIPITSLPIAKGVVLSKMDSPNSEAEIQEMNKIPYRSLIGCLAYIASRTRPDISFAVNIFSQFQENPAMIHWNFLLKLLGYVKSTQHYKLNLSNIRNLDISCYSDADFASNRDDRVSMGGIVLFLDEAPIIWRTFKQKCVALSTMESEYITLTEAAKELQWVIHIIQECISLDLFPKNANFSGQLLCDNQAAIDFSHSPIENNRTKHISVRYHFLRNLIYENIFNLKHVRSKKNFADIFTKPLPKEGAKVMKFFTWQKKKKE